MLNKRVQNRLVHILYRAKLFTGLNVGGIQSISTMEYGIKQSNAVSNVNPQSACDFYSDHAVPIASDAAKYEPLTHRTHLRLTHGVNLPQ